MVCTNCSIRLWSKILPSLFYTCLPLRFTMAHDCNTRNSIRIHKIQFLMHKTRFSYTKLDPQNTMYGCVSVLQSNKFILINICVLRCINSFYFEYPTHSLTSIKYSEFYFSSAGFQAFLVPNVATDIVGAHISIL